MADAHGTVGLHIGKEHVLPPRELHGRLLPSAEQRHVQPVFQDDGRLGREHLQVFPEILQVLGVCHAASVGQRVGNWAFP